MKAFRIVVLVILGILLSLSLLVFGIALTLNQSLLNPDFVADHFDEVDIAELADEMVRDQIPAEAADFMGDSLEPILTDTIADIEDWLKEQARDGIYVLYDYIEDRSQSLSLEISIETVKTTFHDNLLAAILASPPPELSGYTPAQIEAEFNNYWSQIDAEIPSTLTFDETMIDAAVLENIDMAKRYVGYFNLAFIILIAFSLLMILLIILTYMEVRGSTRQLGFTFLAIGVVLLVGALIARSVIGGMITGGDIPTTIQSWLPSLVSDVLMPLIIYSGGLIVAGIPLVIVSFLYNRGEAEYYY
jgi:hypothetical protein